jgi:hypothetical protein
VVSEGHGLGVGVGEVTGKKKKGGLKIKSKFDTAVKVEKSVEKVVVEKVVVDD